MDVNDIYTDEDEGSFNIREEVKGEIPRVSNAPHLTLNYNDNEQVYN